MPIYVSAKEAHPDKMNHSSTILPQSHSTMENSAAVVGQTMNASENSPIVRRRKQSYLTAKLPNGTMQYKCTVCGEMFSSEGDMVSHKKKHVLQESGSIFSAQSANGKLTNSTMSQSQQDDRKHGVMWVNQESSLGLHHPKLRLHLCQHCKEAFLSKELLTEHQETSHQVTPSFSCDICDLSFKQRGQCHIHKSITHYGLFVRCPSCEETFDDEPLFNLHWQCCRNSDNLQDNLPKPKVQMNMENHDSHGEVCPKATTQNAESSKCSLKTDSTQQAFNVNVVHEDISHNTDISTNNTDCEKEKSSIDTTTTACNSPGVTSVIDGASGLTGIKCKVCHESFSKKEDLNRHILMSHFGQSLSKSRLSTKAFAEKVNCTKIQPVNENCQEGSANVQIQSENLLTGAQREMCTGPQGQRERCIRVQGRAEKDHIDEFESENSAKSECSVQEPKRSRHWHDVKGQVEGSIMMNGAREMYTKIEGQNENGAYEHCEPENTCGVQPQRLDCQRVIGELIYRVPEGCDKDGSPGEIWPTVHVKLENGDGLPQQSENGSGIPSERENMPHIHSDVEHGRFQPEPSAGLQSQEQRVSGELIYNVTQPNQPESSEQESSGAIQMVKCTNSQSSTSHQREEVHTKQGDPQVFPDVYVKSEYGGVIENDTDALESDSSTGQGQKGNLPRVLGELVYTTVKSENPSTVSTDSVQIHENNCYRANLQLKPCQVVLHQVQNLVQSEGQSDVQHEMESSSTGKEVHNTNCNTDNFQLKNCQVVLHRLQDLVQSDSQSEVQHEVEFSSTVKKVRRLKGQSKICHKIDGQQGQTESGASEECSSETFPSVHQRSDHTIQSQTESPSPVYTEGESCPIVDSQPELGESENDSQALVQVDSEQDQCTMKNEEETQVHKCSMCSKAYGRKGNLLRHMRLIHRVLSYECLACDKAFVSRAGLRIHRTTHSKSATLNNHQAQDCSTSPESKSKKQRLEDNSPSSKAITLENQTINNNESNPLAKNSYECQTCHKSFSYEFQFLQHRPCMHKRLKCPACDETFAFKMTCDQHYKSVHLGSLVCQPRDCPAPPESVTLDNHQPQDCPSGSETIACKSQKLMSENYTLSTKTITLECQSNNKTESDPLAKNSYECQTCHKSFAYEFQFLQHRPCMHKRLKCPACDETFAFKTTCDQHYKSVHLGSLVCGPQDCQTPPESVALDSHMTVTSHDSVDTDELKCSNVTNLQSSNVINVQESNGTGVQSSNTTHVHVSDVIHVQSLNVTDKLGSNDNKIKINTGMVQNAQSSKVGENTLKQVESDRTCPKTIRKSDKVQEEVESSITVKKVHKLKNCQVVLHKLQNFVQSEGPNIGMAHNAQCTRDGEYALKQVESDRTCSKTIRKSGKVLGESSHVAINETKDGTLDIPSSNKVSRKKEFICELCDGPFTEEIDLFKHECLILKEYPECPICDKKFTNIARHYKAVHLGYRPYKCIECDKAFSDKRILQNHQQKTHKGYLLLEGAAETGSSTQSTNVGRNSEERKKDCDDIKSNQNDNECSNVSVKSLHEVLGNAKENTHDEQGNEKLSPKKLIHRCPLCRKGFRYRFHFIRHYESVHVQPVKCSPCPKASQGKQALGKHKQINHGQSSSSSENTPMIQTRFDDDDQEGNNRMNEKTLLQCEMCSESFSKNAALIRHQRYRHNIFRPHKCPVCSKRFSQKWNCDRHYRSIHCQVRPCKCLTCGKEFAKKQGLKNHRCASSSVPNKQTISKAKGLRYVRGMNSNQQKSGRKSSKSFSRSAKSAHKLALLRNKHVSNKGYAKLRTCTCPVCNKPFSSKANCERHRRNIHLRSMPNENQKCDALQICPNKTSDRSNESMDNILDERSTEKEPDNDSSQHKPDSKSIPNRLDDKSRQNKKDNNNELYLKSGQNNSNDKCGQNEPEHTTTGSRDHPAESDTLLYQNSNYNDADKGHYQETKKIALKLKLYICTICKLTYKDLESLKNHQSRKLCTEVEDDAQNTSAEKSTGAAHGPMTINNHYDRPNTEKPTDIRHLTLTEKHEEMITEDEKVFRPHSSDQEGCSVSEQMVVQNKDDADDVTVANISHSIHDSQEVVSSSVGVTNMDIEGDETPPSDGTQINTASPNNFMYECTLCKEKFESSLSLIVHIRAHMAQ